MTSRKNESSESRQNPEIAKENSGGDTDSWHHRMNKWLIAIGVIAFGLIITDRIVEAFRVDNVPALVADQTEKQAGEAAGDSLALTSAGIAETPLQDDSKLTAAMAEAADSSGLEAAATERTGSMADAGAGSVLTSDDGAHAGLNELFGSRIIFVSMAEPAYVLTEEPRRYEVGTSLNDTTSLAGITNDGLILDTDGELQLFGLPEPR